MTATISAPAATARETTWLEAGGDDLVQADWLTDVSARVDVEGVVLRPSALAAAVPTGGRFDRAIRHLALATAVTARTAVSHLVAAELRGLADALMAPPISGDAPTRWAIGWADPRVARDSVALFSDARAISRHAARPNVMVTIPATGAGLRAFEWLVAEGVAVHVALVPSPDRLRAAVVAYVTGLRARRARRLPLGVDAVVSPAVVYGDMRTDALAAAASPTVEGRDDGATLAELIECGAKPLRLAMPGRDLSLPGDERVVPAAAGDSADDDDAAVHAALSDEVAAYQSLDAAVSARVTVIQRELRNMVGCPICLEARGT